MIIYVEVKMKWVRLRDAQIVVSTNGVVHHYSDCLVKVAIKNNARIDHANIVTITIKDSSHKRKEVKRFLNVIKMDGLYRCLDDPNHRWYLFFDRIIEITFTEKAIEKLQRFLNVVEYATS